MNTAELSQLPYIAERDAKFWVVVREPDKPEFLGIGYFVEPPESKRFDRELVCRVLSSFDLLKGGSGSKIVSAAKAQELEVEVERVVAMLNLAEQGLAKMHGYTLADCCSEVIGRREHLDLGKTIY